MTFEEILDHAMAMLQRRGRLTYGTLKRQFQLDDAALDDLKNELIEGQRLAIDERGNVLVWIGAAGPASPAPAPSATTQAHAPLTYTPPYLAEKILTARRALEGERKQVTVLFADLKGSMELLAERDPEEARQLLDPVLEHMMEAVHRYEGTVNQVMGDGIMALFGAPVAHEDHAVRACYAALRMQERVQHYAAEVQRTYGVPLHIRVGLNAGEVVVRAISNDLHLDYTAVGQTTHLAARMEQMAMPGSTLITPAVLALAEGYVQVRALGPVPVKGLSAPVEVYELVGVSAVRRRLQATAARGLTRFIGRDTELATLVQALARAGAGQGQVVALVGEAGVGKSRLVYEFVRAHHVQGWLVLESAAVSYGKAAPYVPVIDLLKRYMHVEDRDDARTIRAKVTGHVLTLDEGLQESLPALLELLDALPEDSPFLRLDPPQRRQRTLSALKRLLLRESQVQPLLLVCEDLHWIDSETQTLLESLVESLPTTRILLLMNYRPEYQHGWSSKTYYTQVRLDPLPPASAAAFLQVLMGHDASLDALKQLLMTRTEGNPFFLEESVRTLVETQMLIGARGAYRLAQSLASLHVPATVHAVLASRLDRLAAEDKRLLQTAAVIGHDVPYPLLQAVAAIPEEALQRSLTRLQAAEFLYETRLFPDLEYAFKHTLTHEVAYGSLLHERRRALHACIVEALEQLHAARLPEQVERLAHHALRGEMWDKAVTYCQQAGARAGDRAAFREAVTSYEQALAVLHHLPQGRDTRAQAIDLRLALRSALHPLGAFAQMADHMREAEALAEDLDDQRRLGEVSAFMTGYLWLIGGDPARALASGQRALAIATDLGDLALQVTARHTLGLIYRAQGNYHQAIECHLQNVTALQGDLLRERFGNPGVVSVQSRTGLCRTLPECGMFREAMAYDAEGLRIAEAVDHPYSLVEAHALGTTPYIYRGEVEHAIPRLERALGLCQHYDVPRFFPDLAARLGTAYALAGRCAEGLPLLEQAVEQAATMHLLADHVLHIVWLGEAYLLAGRVEEASMMAGRALDLARAHQERGNEAYALRLLGAIHSQRTPSQMEVAIRYYQQALTLAEELDMRPLQAHCHRGLGPLYATTGQREQAHAALSAAVELYRAMDMTFWLPQAEAVLVRVA